MQQDTDLIRPKSIKITRVEGPVDLCGLPQEAKTWEEADAILYSHSSTAPNNGCYDKVDFEILFEDGSIYTGRYDLVNWSVEVPSLSRHVKSFVSYLAGNAPTWMHEKADVLRQYYKDRDDNPEQVAQAKHMLTDYYWG